MAAAALAGSAARPAALTIVLEFRGPHSDNAVTAMQREVEDILKGTRVNFEWRTREQFADSVVDNLVVFRFNGRCVLEPVGYLMDERGPLAFTYSSNGVILPFSEVACDRVTAVVRPALAMDDYARADLLLGRALGRVMAHELVHMLSHSSGHGHRGVAQPVLTGPQLISPILRLDASDIERIYTQP